VTAVTAEWVRAAHGDAWQALAVAGSAELPGVRLAATGLAHPQWNNGDVDDPSQVDIAAVRAWYDGLGVPWGMRLPAGAPWTHGQRLFTKRLMGLTTTAFRPAPIPTGAVIRSATPTDLGAYLQVDATAFGEDPEVQRPWLALLLDHPAATVAVAEVDGAIVASGHVVVSTGRAGPAGYVGGIAVLPQLRRRGVGAAISSWLVRTTGDGVGLWHLHPDTDEAARIYRRLGFSEVDGLDIYVDC